MADTYFGYKERDASAQINWAEVGKGFSDTLNKEAQRREQQKQQIDDATREYQKVLADAPKGQSDALNGLSADFADQVSNNMLMVNRLLKSGQLSVKDFTRIRQNMIDNTDLMYTVLGDANKYFATHMERINNGTASAMESQNMERIENLANLKNTRTYVDPETGLVSLGKLKEVNGVLELDKAPGSFMTINQLRDNLNTFYNKFDVDGKLKEKEVALGQVTESIVQLSNVAGGLNTILTTSDKKLGEYGLSDDEKEIVQNYKKYEDEMLKEFTTNPVQLSSILIDYVGGYQIEFDKEKFDKDETGKLIYMNNDGVATVPEFTDKQKEEAKEYLRTRFRSMIGVEKKRSGSTRPFDPANSPSNREYNRGKAQEKERLTLWNELWGADPERRNVVISQIISDPTMQKAGLIDIVATEAVDRNGVTGTELEFKYLNEAKNKTVFAPNDISQNDWAALGTEVHGKTAKEAVETGGGFTEGVTRFNTDWENVAQQGRRGNIDYITEANKDISGKLPSYTELFLENDDDAVTRGLIQQVIGAYGFSTASSGWDAKDQVTVTAPDGETSQTFKLYNLTEAAAYDVYESLMSFIAANMLESTAEAVYNTRKEIAQQQVGSSKPTTADNIINENN